MANADHKNPTPGGISVRHLNFSSIGLSKSCGRSPGRAAIPQNHGILKKIENFFRRYTKKLLENNSMQIPIYTERTFLI